ncbi:MAG: IS66 family transposase [Dehalococcoidia bacterium]
MNDNELARKIAELPVETQRLLYEHPALRQLLEELFGLIDELQREVKRLQDLLKLNSHNSSKPPSSDQPRVKREVVNLRNSTGRKPGGQMGHPGTTLQAVSNPDNVVRHKVNVCSHCGEDLSSVEATDVEKRQEFDIPPIKFVVTEHQAEVKVCPECHAQSKGDFPEGITQPVQYAERPKSLAVYLNQYQLIPYKRVTEIFEDVLGGSISQGTLLNALETSYNNLASTEERIKVDILNSPTVHFDDTGLYRGGQRIWLHTASTEEHTYYFPHERRGREALDAAGILPEYKGVAVHDHFEPYNSYEDCSHAFCNVHHLRELTRAYEQDGVDWAKEMADLLMEIKGVVDEAKDSGKQALEPSLVNFYHQRYQGILSEALKGYPPNGDVGEGRRRGRKKQSKDKNLLDRLIKYKAGTLRFMEDFQVPFDNNLVERDQRMVKVKQKISGCFRSENGADYFCRIRGFISTVKKQEKDVLEHLRKTFQPANGRDLLLSEG